MKQLLSKADPYRPFKIEILERRQEVKDTFTLKLDVPLKHDPGQFVQLSIPGIGECPISISSYSSSFLELTIHEIGMVTNTLSKLKKGDTIFVRGPYGKGYPMKETKGKNLVLIGGGCGVAPLKGVVSYLDKHRHDYGTIDLFFGYRSPEHILFKDEMPTWKELYKLNVSVDKAPTGGCYTGNVGFITQLLEKSQLSPQRNAAMLCGPPVMMKFCIDILQKKGFHEDQIYISAERLMYCAFGECCHCMIKGKFTCLDGPVFRYDQIKEDFNEEH